MVRSCVADPDPEGAGNFGRIRIRIRSPDPKLEPNKSVKSFGQFLSWIRIQDSDPDSNPRFESAFAFGSRSETYFTPYQDPKHFFLGSATLVGRGGLRRTSRSIVIFQYIFILRGQATVHTPSACGWYQNSKYARNSKPVFSRVTSFHNQMHDLWYFI
jgi:hypothetical protein